MHSLAEILRMAGGDGRVSQRLGDVIRARRDEIIALWEAGVRALPHARTLDEPRLVDHVPELLDGIASITDDGGTLQERVAAQHALARLEEGFDILEVIGEFQVLREVVLEICDSSSSELRVLHRAIDTAISGSVDRYADVRERTLQGFDRIGAAALESRSLDDLLRRLLQVLHETTPSIDSSTIYLREGDVLRVRAAVGVGRELEEGHSVTIGESFAGTIAARAEPMTVHAPTQDQRVLHGVPIKDDSRVIGVAKIGSTTADDFSLQDRRIFAAMVARASAAIVQHVLREQAQSTAEQLAERERQLRALADNIPQLAWMADASGSIYWYNRRWYELTGTTLEDAGGWGWERLHHADHLDRVKEGWLRALASGQPWEDTFPLRGKDGHYRWFLSRAVPIRDASGNLERWFGTNTDVTARRFLDDATRLLNSSLDYRQTLDQLAQLVVPELADWCVVDVREDSRLDHVAVAHADPGKLDVAREKAAALARDPVVRDLMRTGEARMLAETWIAAPLLVRGQAIGVIHLVSSDSGRRYSATDVDAARELGQRAGAAVENARLYRDAQDALRMRDDVLAIVSHDLRNPLGAIGLGATLLLQQHGGDPRARKHLDAIRRSADRMEHLIDDLLDMASINVGKLTMKPVFIDARDLLEEMVDIHVPLAAERSITILRECDLRGVLLHADRDRLMQAFGNLIGNALKFCNPGDVIYVRCTVDAEHVRYRLTDTGPGIPKPELAHIFEPYWSGRSGRKKGTGLGLFIAKAIVEAHAGTITVESEEGRGTMFEVALPIARD